MVTRTHELQSWIDRLTHAELPALAAVVHDLQRLTAEHGASVQQLADVLLRDATLTTKVLRVANSAHYNPAREPIRTLSRAIVLIGFDTVRAVGVSVSLVDGLLGKAPREQLAALLARAFHGAVQARALASYVAARQQEEVFIAALLKDLGGPQADALAMALSEPGAEVEATIRAQLGTGFRPLTQGLAKSWGLTGTLGLALGNGRGDPAAEAVRLGRASLKWPWTAGAARPWPSRRRAWRRSLASDRMKPCSTYWAPPTKRCGWPRPSAPSRSCR